MTVVKVSNLLYTGLPADSKPAADTGARFYQTDAGGTFIDKVYWYNGSAWLLDAAASGGGGPSAIAPGESRPTVAVTIADGASLSGVADIRGYRPTAIIYPAGWDAAITTFQASADASTYNNVYDGDGNELTIPSRTAAGYVGLTAIEQLALMGADYIKVRSGTSGSAVNQSGAVIVTLVLEPL